MTVQNAIDEFLIAVEADGLSRSSVRWYRAILKPLGERLGAQQLGDVTTNMMRRYLVDLRNRDNRYQSEQTTRPEVQGGLSEESVAAHVRALHRFWSWATAEYRLTANPMSSIKRPPRRSPQPKGIDLADLRKLFAATADDPSGSRNRAILAFLIDTGCRAEGVIGLELSKFDPDQRRAIVTEKGRKTRTVFLTETTILLIEAWGRVRPKNATTVFCSLSNLTSGKPLSYEGLMHILSVLKARAGVTGRVNPHSFRHAFARQYIKNGGDLSTLSRLMGHSDTAVTSWYYAVFTGEELAHLHDRFSPLKGVIDKPDEPPENP
jgi:site-specific recombinase XerD